MYRPFWLVSVYSVNKRGIFLCWTVFFDWNCNKKNSKIFFKVKKQEKSQINANSTRYNFSEVENKAEDRIGNRVRDAVEAIRSETKRNEVETSQARPFCFASLFCLLSYHSFLFIHCSFAVCSISQFFASNSILNGFRRVNILVISPQTFLFEAIIIRFETIKIQQSICRQLKFKLQKV